MASDYLATIDPDQIATVPAHLPRALYTAIHRARTGHSASQNEIYTSTALHNMQCPRRLTMPLCTAKDITNTETTYELYYTTSTQVPSPTRKSLRSGTHHKRTARHSLRLPSSFSPTICLPPFPPLSKRKFPSKRMNE